MHSLNLLTIKFYYDYFGFFLITPSMTLRHLPNRNVENSFYNLKIGLFDTYTCITKFGGSEYHIIPNFNFHFKKVIKLTAIVPKKIRIFLFTYYAIIR